MKTSSNGRAGRPPSLQLAVRHHTNGQLQEAEALYRRILQTNPRDVNALNLLGLLLHQRADNEAATTYLRQAIALHPGFFDAYNNLGVALEAGGQLDEAATAYRRAIALKQDHAAAHYNLGNVLRRMGMPADAVASYRQALHYRPDYPEAHCNLGNTLKEQGQLTQAIACYRNALALHADDAQAHNNLGSALREHGQLDEAVSHCLLALKILPNFYEAYNNLGNALQELERLDEAAACFQRALQLAPDTAEIHNNFGNVLKKQDETVAAITCFLQALQLKPDFANAYSNLGDALTALGNFTEAIDCCRHAIALEPTCHKAYINLGNVFKAQGLLEQALDAYRNALRIDPHDPVIHNNLGNVLKEQGHPDLAIECYRQALQLKADDHAAHNNLGNVLLEQGKLEPAIACYRQALQIRPNYHEAHNNLGNALQDLGELDEAIACYRQAVQLKPGYQEAWSNLLFCHNYHPTLAADEIFAAYRAWNEEHAAPLSRDLPAFDNTRNPTRRLKIAYLSPDFRQHSVAHFFLPLVEQHDKSRVEVFCYYNHFAHDACTERIAAAADHWVVCRALSDEQLAQRIRDDGIDILVDLAGHTAGNRLLVCARKPAPIQVSWLGFGYTTGLTAIDYFLGDTVFTPPGSERWFSETVYRLPRAAWIYQPPAAAPAPNALPAVHRGYVTFACLSRSERINLRMIAVWADILHRAPQARLRLDSRNFGDPALRSTVTARFAAHGIGADRLDMRFTSPVWEVYHDVDIVFDCFPHNSGTTTLEALWMGIPVITMADRPSVGRLGASLLTQLGKPQWIAHDGKDYVERAVALAEDIEQLARERSTLRQAMRDSPLLDQANFACDMEAAYREMWRRWCDQRRESL